MNEEQLRDYRARMMVAELFRTFLNRDGERVRLMKQLGVSRMPAIIPALTDTLVCEIWETAHRYFENGEEHVIVPVGFLSKGAGRIRLCVLIASTQSADSFWQLDMTDVHESTDMGQIVEALDATKKWDVRELDLRQQQDLKDLVTLM